MPQVQILSISCSFWENFANLCVGAPPGLVPPPRGNPGFATASTYIGTGDKSVCEELLDVIHVEPHAKVLCLLDTKQTSDFESREIFAP